MGKGRFFGSIVALGALVLAASWWEGCGKSNEQGISFRALGFFADGTGATGDTGRCASIQNDTSVPNDTNADGTLDGGFLGLQNNMIQGVQVDRVDLSYRVSGSSLSIPSDAFGLSERLGPSSGQEASPNTATHFSQIVIASPQIFQFLNDHRNELPEPPFTMIATARGVGTSDSGDVFETNKVSYEIIFVDGSCVPATPTPAASGTPAR